MHRLPRLIVPWLSLICGLYLVIHYAWVMDDGFVYFRYVDNFLILNHGLVYNAGEYVEGYSSPLWTLLLIPIRSLQFNWWTILRLLGVLSLAGTWFALWRMHRVMVPQGPVVGLPFLFLGLSYGPLTHFTSGLETPLVQLMAASYAWLVVRPQSRAAQVLVGLSPLVRHELLLPLLVISALAVWRRKTRLWVAWGTFVGSMSAWMIFRITYYASLVPNTFALKDGTWWSQGMRYLADATLAYHVPWLLLAGGIVVYVLQRRRVDTNTEARLAMILVGLPVLIYVVRIGGDFVHYRTLAFPITLMLCALSGLPELALARIPGRARLATTVATAVGLAALFFTARPPQLTALPFYIADFPYNRDNKLVDNTVRSGEIEDAMTHRAQPDLKFNPWGDGFELELRDEMAANPTTEPVPLLADYWCVRIYKKWDTHTVHGLALTSPILAYIDVGVSRPGHKWLVLPFARQMAGIYTKYGPTPDAFEHLMSEGLAPEWVRNNIETIRLLKRRIHNTHSPLENLRLALANPRPIRLSDAELDWSRGLMKNVIERSWEK